MKKPDVMGFEVYTSNKGAFRDGSSSYSRIPCGTYDEALKMAHVCLEDPTNRTVEIRRIGWNVLKRWTKTLIVEEER